MGGQDLFTIFFRIVVKSILIVTSVLEENAMKTLDVQALHNAIDQTLEQLKNRPKKSKR
ncbi:hypothetical protein BSONL12_12241 [Bacillus sonorensis L12]|uniref:Uncharacterized protein n=1 Tax=Bacillus sonorensis L12 TaxID=1274524 RepID=M5P540_9BACI|nr:hypothetical protein BSONL12_12241 [Bacillus sonorensis L12]